MRIRWTIDAVDDLENIHSYIGTHDPRAAERVVRILVDGVATLDGFPERGRAGRVANTRELVFPSLPFIVVYEVDSEVMILRILHAAHVAAERSVDFAVARITLAGGSTSASVPTYDG